jgi:hypothetical protein
VIIDAKLSRMAMNRLQALLDALERNDVSAAKIWLEQLAWLLGAHTAKENDPRVEPLCATCPVRFNVTGQDQGMKRLERTSQLVMIRNAPGGDKLSEDAVQLIANILGTKDDGK